MFADNTAGKEGGAIEWRWGGVFDVILVRNSVFYRNLALHGAGVRLQAMHGGVAFENVTAAENAATSIALKKDGLGGVVHNAEPARGGSSVVLRGFTAWGNSAGRGGVLYSDRGVVVTLSGIVAFQNTAYAGGVFFCIECDLIGTQLDTVPMIRCKTESGRGLPYMDRNTVVGRVPYFKGRYPAMVADLLNKFKGRAHSVFANNSAATQGGALYCSKCGGCALNEATFINNAAQQGGALFASNNDVEFRSDVDGLYLVMLHVEFDGNTAVYSS